MEKPSINELVAEEIRVLLARRRMSASDLARRAGMTQRAVSRRLTGEKIIDVDDLQRIAEVLGVDIVELLPRPNEGRVVTTAGEIRKSTTVAKHMLTGRTSPFGPANRTLPPTSTRRPARISPVTAGHAG